MKTKIKKTVIVCFVFLLLIQFYQPSRNIYYAKDLPNDITQVYNVPKTVEAIFTTSCYDCHSNTTVYPWYANVQPVRYMLDLDIIKGKENLNFNEWKNYSTRKQTNKLNRIVKQIEANEMPLCVYTLIHKNALLSNAQKNEIISWINSIQLENEY